MFGLVEKIYPGPIDEPPSPKGPDDLGFGDYASKPDAWALIWTYRRLKNLGDKPTAGDLSLQNWGYLCRSKQGGNDYPFGYLFKSKAETNRERNDWQGGVDLEVMAAAERRALAWHGWFKDHTPKGLDPKQLTLGGGGDGTGARAGESSLHPRCETIDRFVGGFLLKVSSLYPAFRHVAPASLSRIESHWVPIQPISIPS